MLRQVTTEDTFLRRLAPLTGANYRPSEQTRRQVAGVTAITISAATGTGKTRIMGQMPELGVHVVASNVTRPFEARDLNSESRYRHYHNINKPGVRQYVGNLIRNHIPVQVERNPATGHFYFSITRAFKHGQPNILELTENARKNVVASNVFDTFYQAHVIAPTYEHTLQAVHIRGNDWTPEEALGRAAEAYSSIGSAVCDQTVVFIRTDYDDTASSKVADVLKGNYPQSESDAARVVAISVHKQILAKYGEQPELGIMPMNYPIAA